MTKKRGSTLYRVTHTGNGVVLYLEIAFVMHALRSSVMVKQYTGRGFEINEWLDSSGYREYDNT